VALATGLGVPLVTADGEVLRAFPKVAIDPQRFLDDE
jgi:predicted nucleic acid-binding protein